MNPYCADVSYDGLTAGGFNIIRLKCSDASYDPKDFPITWAEMKIEDGMG